jgi:hypothetical protein
MYLVSFDARQAISKIEEPIVADGTPIMPSLCFFLIYSLQPQNGVSLLDIIESFDASVH